ncbi:MAG: succinylglutamate desuccinylase/aspartoacylase family protein [Maribacter sp.]
MAKIYSKALKKYIDVGRFIGQIRGGLPGPTLIFVGGVHGNEPSGIFALHQVLNSLKAKTEKLHGNIYALAGNLPALEKGIRYQKEDLNRIWNLKRIEESFSKTDELEDSEVKEALKLYQCIDTILKKESGPFYFIDLHTTSSPTEPFITVNDNLLNRKFTKQYPVPLLLGIEEYLEGTFLNYINDMGYVAFGFESGQHDALVAIENHIAFIYLSLVFAGSLPKSEIAFEKHYKLLKKTTHHLASCYEIVYHYKIEKNEQFEMLPGFKNFESIPKGSPIAISDEQSVAVPQTGNIFMPLYQKKGNDGFFIIKPVPIIFLRLSAILRKLHIDYLLPFLPGISWVAKKHDALLVDLKIARFFAKKFFHLLGYRNRQLGDTTLTIRNREANSLKEMYRRAPWY